MIWSLMEGDVLSLSNEFILTKNFLVDSRLGAKHAVSGSAYRALRLMESPIEATKWLGKNCLTDPDGLELLSFLNQIGAIKLKRRLGKSAVSIFINIGWFANGVKTPIRSYRRPANFPTVVLATLRATKLIWLSWPPILLLVYGTGAFNEAKFALVSGFSLVTILASICLHEWCHVGIARRAGVKSSVLQQGLRLGVLHARLPGDSEAISALVGPIVGFLFGLTAGLIAGIFDPSLTGIGVLVGSLHIASWLPWYGDGITLLSRLKTRSA